MKVLNQYNEKLKSVDLVANNINDPDWKKIIEILQKNNIKVMTGSKNKMCFTWKEEWE